MKILKFQSKRQQSCGFSLLEVLIAVFILSIGLLGLAALHATSLKANHGAYHKSQATFLAYDMVDRLRANRPQAINGSYNQLITEGDKTGTTLADADVNSWLVNTLALLPSGDGSINCTAAGACTVVVQWNITREGGQASGGSATLQTFTFRTDV
ncbi:MAG: type IV pilus modification protein PilV [Gammaproteobacteria bacterium]|nr:MAG: type IV pilus modification protein PilV [Gammaproteobacteria bacterium]